MLMSTADGAKANSFQRLFRSAIQAMTANAIQMSFEDILVAMSIINLTIIIYASRPYVDTRAIQISY